MAPLIRGKVPPARVRSRSNWYPRICSKLGLSFGAVVKCVGCRLQGNTAVLLLVLILQYHPTVLHSSASIIQSNIGVLLGNAVVTRVLARLGCAEQI